LAAVLLLAACGGEEPTPTAVSITLDETAEPEPTDAPTEVPTDVPPTNTPEPTATAEPTAIPEPAYTAEFESTACEFAVPPGRDVECGYLTVPENRNDVENGRTVRLHVAVFAS